MFKNDYVILRNDIVDRIKVKIFNKETRNFHLYSTEDENLDKILKNLVYFRSYNFKNKIKNFMDDTTSNFLYDVKFNNLWNNIKMEFLFDVSEEELFYIKLKFC